MGASNFVRYDAKKQQNVTATKSKDVKSQCDVKNKKIKDLESVLGLKPETPKPLPKSNIDLNTLPSKVYEFVEKYAELCQPDNIHICDGTDNENKHLINTMLKLGMLQKLHKYKNCYCARTDPADVARVESRTVICSKDRRSTIPTPKPGVKGTVGNWISPDSLDQAVKQRFPACMKGRTMYVIPFSMGPIGGPISKIGIQLTDSPYVVVSMRVMSRMGSAVLDTLGEGEFVRCAHSVGVPLPTSRHIVNNWPCNPEQLIVAHKPESNEIISYGSGYGGNSLLGKKCFALRIGSSIAQKEGWLAEHMLVLGITSPSGVKRYIAAAFPSGCGKTNLAMMKPTLPGYKVECVGDDIAWMKFDSEGRLRAINPENGFFGIAPGTNMKTNPSAMEMVMEDTIFTNVATTSDGGVYWEGMEKEINPNVKITTWKNMPYNKENSPAAHPNSRFCTPLKRCSVKDGSWDDPTGVPIDAILFGGRRPEGVPLIYEAFDWKHGVLIGAAVRSEATAAAEHKGKTIMHDPFAMRPFFGYNVGHYFGHWLSLEKQEGRKLPKIFHVNWFRKDEQGKFMWPGFGENSRILDWILRRVEGEDIAVDTPIGKVPKPDTINLDGLPEKPNMTKLFHLPKDFWLREVDAIERYFDEQIGEDLPNQLSHELQNQRKRIQKL